MSGRFLLEIEMSYAYTAKEIEKFWKRVDKEKSQTFYNGTRCWEWTAGVGSDGYGHAWMGKKMRGTHRISYELAFGEILNDLHTLHHCDNKLCVNPLHLWIGTNLDNIDDMHSKGRQGAARGEDHPSHKLSDAQVAEIRRLYAWHGIGGKDMYQLAREFGVSSGYISDIVNNKRRT